MAAERFFLGAGLVIGAIAIAGYWWVAIAAIANGKLFAYANYWGAPIGTIGLVIVLTILTPAWFWAAWRYMKKTTRG